MFTDVIFLQVWRFLITFSDVLSLWPFTLDELVQAFHDYVSSIALHFCCELTFLGCQITIIPILHPCVFIYCQDPRLLGEIHIALLRSIIKDIEDVARTSSAVVGVNQNNAANPGGGHPQIVEGVCSFLFLVFSSDLVTSFIIKTKFSMPLIMQTQIEWD